MWTDVGMGVCEDGEATRVRSRVGECAKGGGAGGVGGHADRREDVVVIWVQFVEGCGCGEGVGEGGLTTGFCGGLEAVEELEAGWVGEVGCVCVEGEGEVGVGCVYWVGLGGEVPEGTVLGWADEGDAIEEGFGGRGVGWGVMDEAEAVCADLLEEGLEAGGCWVHD